VAIDAPLQRGPAGAPPAGIIAGRRRADGVARWIALSGAVLLLVVLAAMLIRMGQVSAPIWKARGIGWVFGSVWAPSNGQFGALPLIAGTLVTSAIAVVIAAPIGIGTALFISELAPQKLRRPVGGLIDLLAAVPSVVYGLWGIFVLTPILRPIEQGLAKTLGRAIPLFAGPAPGPSFFVAGVILAIMILPTVSAVCREVFLTVPRDHKEAALALGSTRWESIRMSVLPQSRQGIVGALILGLGRALGETVAVVMVIGNTPTISKSILVPGYTMASSIANEFQEATGATQQALIGVGLVLFVIAVLVNVVARLLVRDIRAKR
jgi:phosphate transport system permease protein